MEKTPFDCLPYNGLKSYVKATTHEGTDIYIPVNSVEIEVMVKRKNELKAYLTSLPKVN